MMTNASLSFTQTNVLILHGGYPWSQANAYNCVQGYAGTSGSFTLCGMGSGPFYSAPPCFTNLSSYDLILIDAVYNALNVGFINQLITYIQGGGSVYFETNTNPRAPTINAIQSQNINDLLAAIGQGPVVVSYNNSTLTEIPTVTGLISVCTTPTSAYFATGDVLTGPSLSNAFTTSSLSIGTYQAFWDTGYGGVLGIGTEYYSSGNWCSLSHPNSYSGEIIWEIMTGNSLDKLAQIV